MRVLLVTSWDTPCGIADYAWSLRESVQRADPEIEVIPDPATLDPYEVRRKYCSHRDVQAGKTTIDLIHLNHHDALHARWTAHHVREFTREGQTGGIPVVVTYHDTRERLEDCPKLAALAQVASSTIVHEPVEGLHAIYWRQGVPAPALAPVQYYSHHEWQVWSDAFRSVQTEEWRAFKTHPQQPVLGTVGFNFPWKNYDRLCQVTAEAGWAMVILSNNATPEDEARWRSLNSAILVLREYLPQDRVVNFLAGCDATAFMYECANTGTSGAIRMGIAARKPVIALGTCRQFRDLYLDRQHSIDWVVSWERFQPRLEMVFPCRYDPPLVGLAHRESWTIRGQDHARLYRMLVDGVPPP